MRIALVCLTFGFGLLGLTNAMDDRANADAAARFVPEPSDDESSQPGEVSFADADDDDDDDDGDDSNAPVAAMVVFHASPRLHSLALLIHPLHDHDRVAGLYRPPRLA